MEAPKQAQDVCIICQRSIPSNVLEAHLNQCFEYQSKKFQKTSSSKTTNPATKSNKRTSNDKTYDIFNASIKKQKIDLKPTVLIPEKKEIKVQETKIAVKNEKIHVPLAELMRPIDFVDYYGQNQAVGENTIIRNLLKNNVITSTIFYGPPGCGKTTLAHIIFSYCKQNNDKFRFVKVSACSAGVNDVKSEIQQAKTHRDTFKKQTILFMDEIHRFNKLQQDTFLPYIENGTIILLGATTENPSFSLNNALLSRCRVIILEKLKSTDIMKILRRALSHYSAIEVPKSVNCDEFVQELEEMPKIIISEESMQWISDVSDGDARIALNSLEMCMNQTEKDLNEIKTITLDNVRESIKRTHLLYDRAGDQHYDMISALHKSIRASDDNASLYWVTRMMEGGEDPRFICRRLIRAASEDIGLADPQSLVLATSTMAAVEKIGMPESDCILAQLAVYLARAPKSTETYHAMLKCKQQIKNHKGPLPAVPIHLRNAPNKFMKSLGYGRDYNTLHKDESGLIYLPEDIKDIDFFE